MRRRFLLGVTAAVVTFLSPAMSAMAQTKSLSENDLLKLLAGGVYNARIASLVRYRGINFAPTAHDLELLKRAGADQQLLHEVSAASRRLPAVNQSEAQAQHHFNATRSSPGTRVSQPPNPNGPEITSSNAAAVPVRRAQNSHIADLSHSSGFVQATK